MNGQPSLENMQRHLDALYSLDSCGRLLRVNEEGGGDAPLLFLGRTRDGNVWNFHAAVDDETANRLAYYCELEEAINSDFKRPPAYADEYLAILRNYTGERRIDAGPAYAFSDGLAHSSENVVFVTESNVEILRRYLKDWIPDIKRDGPMFVYLNDGDAVSICCSVRITREAHEAGVETADEFKGRGLAPAVVDAWASEVEKRERVPLYSTSWDNTASQNVARKLGLVLFGADFQIY